MVLLAFAILLAGDRPPAAAEIPKRFRGVWVFDRQFCSAPEGEPGTFITRDGLRREEIWEEPLKIYSISRNGSEMHLRVKHGHEESEPIEIDARWVLSHSGMQLRIVDAGPQSGSKLEEHSPLFRCR